MKIEIKHKIQCWAISIGVLIGILLILHFTCKVEPVEPIISADLIVKCPVCEVCSPCPSCKITAERIISDNPAIDLTKYNNVTKFKLPDLENMEVQIGETTYTKLEIEAIK